MHGVDVERFAAARCAVLESLPPRTGIGRLSEKTLHAVLKLYYEPYFENHEIPVGRYVADIVGEAGIIEIQTADFSRLRKKLEAFSSVSAVMVVHPVAVKRWIYWVDPVSGAVEDPRRAPCKDPRADIALELLRVKEWVGHPNLRFVFPLLEIAEYRYLNPKQRDPHKRFSRLDKVPLTILGEQVFSARSDAADFLPPDLPEIFDSRVFAKQAGSAVSTARLLLKLLTELEIVERVGKEGNRYLYRVANGKTTKEG